MYVWDLLTPGNWVFLLFANICICSQFQWDEWTMKDCMKSIQRMISASDETQRPQRWNCNRTEPKVYPPPTQIYQTLKCWCSHIANNLAHHCKTFDWWKDILQFWQLTDCCHWSISDYEIHLGFCSQFHLAYATKTVIEIGIWERYKMLH